jgi:glycosyltransferase involved in cell wall biosynthesis
MKTVLQILPSLDKINGGVERGTLDIARELANREYNSVIISSGGEMADRYKYKGVTHHEIQLNKKGLINFLSSRGKFKKLLDDIKPDLVHVRSRWPSFCFTSEIKKRKIPYVTTYHGTYSGNQNFLKRSYNKVMTNGDKIISISKFIDDHIRFFFPEFKNKIVQINRGIDTENFNLNSVSQIRKEKLLGELSIPERSHIILLPGRLSSWKGQNVGIDALAHVLKKKPNLNIVMLLVGSEDKNEKFTKKIKKKLKKLKLNDRVIFCGNISDIAAVYSISDIILSTSIEPEAFGRITAEGCSMTKPVIATNHGGSREIIENNLTGWLVNPGEPEVLSEKIIDVLNLEQKKKDLIGRNARKRIVEKFNLKQMLDKTINVYEELIEAKKNFGS